MPKLAFSTVACPQWTLARIAAAAESMGYQGVELRTFGDDSRLLACDPALTDPDKVRATFAPLGLQIVSLATSARFDEVVTPPVIGQIITDTERQVRLARRAIDLAVSLACPLVRVFGFELSDRDSRSAGLARIVARLKALIDHADKTGVKVMLENAGSFARAQDVEEILARVNSPLLGICYALAAGHAAGDDAPAVAARLARAGAGGRLFAARVKDLREGRPCDLGTGELPCRDFTVALARAGFESPLIVEWDKLWLPDLADPSIVLPGAAKAVYSWFAQARGGQSRPVQPGAAPAGAR
jgi:sugar phosphate isomerase/epimerase